MDSWKFTSCGVTREVTVVDTGRTGVERYAVERGSAQFPGACPEDAVVQYTRCAGFLDLREIVPPGAPTRDEIQRERDAWAHRAEQAEAQAASLAARVAALEEIIEGRTTPPTDAEIDAHAAAGRWWRYVVLVDGVPSGDGARDTDAPPYSALTEWPRRAGRSYEERWWALDAQRRPCAWPTAEVPRG